MASINRLSFIGAANPLTGSCCASNACSPAKSRPNESDWHHVGHGRPSLRRARSARCRDVGAHRHPLGAQPPGKACHPPPPVRHRSPPATGPPAGGHSSGCVLVTREEDQFNTNSIDAQLFWRVMPARDIILRSAARLLRCNFREISVIKLDQEGQ